jgi:hypothetical protein
MTLSLYERTLKICDLVDHAGLLLAPKLTPMAAYCDTDFFAVRFPYIDQNPYSLIYFYEDSEL